MPTPIVRLPSLDLLRGFVAVGRRMSITLAAQDLCVTQSAVSRQIRALEQMLGTRLLTRGHRSIAFTSAGERLFRSADSAVQQLQDAIGTVAVRGARQPVTITCTIGIAGLWLLPRLSSTASFSPKINVDVIGSKPSASPKGFGRSPAMAFPGAVKTFTLSVFDVMGAVMCAVSLSSYDSPRIRETTPIPIRCSR